MPKVNNGLIRIDTTTLSRLWNVLVPNLFDGLVPKTPQKAIFRQGAIDAPGFQGGWPQRIFADFPALAAGDTDETLLTLPPDFTLLAILGSSNQSTNGNDFMVELYDTAEQLSLILARAFNGVVMGKGNAPLFESDPHTFSAPEAQCLVRVTNMAAATAEIQVALYGVSGGQ